RTSEFHPVEEEATRLTPIFEFPDMNGGSRFLAGLVKRNFRPFGNKCSQELSVHFSIWLQVIESLCNMLQHCRRVIWEHTFRAPKIVRPVGHFVEVVNIVD